MTNEGGVTCFVCGAPVPIFGNVLWCDACMEECIASGVTIDTFVQQKRAEIRDRQLRKTPPEGMEKLDGN